MKDGDAGESGFPVGLVNDQIVFVVAGFVQMFCAVFM